MDIVIPLNDGANCLVKTGQKVELHDPFLEKKSESIVQLNLAHMLHIEPKKVFRFLKKFVGDSIGINEVIAEKKMLLGSQKIKSPVAGIIKEIEHHHGMLIIRSSSDATNQVKAYFKGEISEVTHTSITLKVRKGKEFPCKSTTSTFGGETLYFDAKGEFSFNAEQTENKVLCAEYISSYNQTKAEALGINGFVTLHSLEEKTSLPYARIKNIADMQKIFDHRFSYCFVHEKNSSMYFYDP